MSTRRTQNTTRRVFVEPAPLRVQLSHLRELVERTPDIPGNATVVLSGLSERYVKGDFEARYISVESVTDAPALPRLVTTTDELSQFLPGAVFRAPHGRIYTQIQLGETLRLQLAGGGWREHAEVIHREGELLVIWEPEGDA